MSTESALPCRAQAGSLRDLVQVAWPLILSSGSLSLMHIIDRILLTWYSTDALAAALPAAMLHFTLLSLAMGTATYVTAFVAQYEGSNQPTRAAAVTWQGLYFVLVFGGLVVACAPFSAAIFRAIGHDPAVQRLEASYFGIMCLGAIPMLATSVMSSFFSGIGSSRVVMWVNMTGVAVNFVLDLLLIFGSPISPRMGIAGAAWATVIGQAVACGLFLWLMVVLPRVKTYEFFRHWRLDRELLGRLVRYGLPNGWTFLSDVAGFSVFILLVGKLGTSALAATNLTFNLNTLAFLPMLGIGTAVMTLVGQRIGDGRPELAERTTWLAAGLTTAFMTFCGAIYVLFPNVIMSPYWMGLDTVPPPEITELVPTLLKFVALYCIFDGMAIVFGSAIRGAGDTRFSLYFSLVAGWSIMVLPTYIAWKYYDGNLMTSWAACSAYIMVLGVGFFIRFRRGVWKSMRVIEPTLVEPTLVTAEPSGDNKERFVPDVTVATPAILAAPELVMTAGDMATAERSGIEPESEPYTEETTCGR